MFTRPTKVALACAATFAAISSANAQSSSELNPVVISASRFSEVTNRVPALVEIITKEQLRDSGITNMPEVLSQLGNLNVRSLSGGQLGVGATVDMRGFGVNASDNTLILLDGQRLNPLDSGSVRWESIPIEAIDRIEILNGGGSVQYGDKAVGGVINIITRSDSEKNKSVTVNTGSFGTIITSGNYSNQVQNTKFNLNFSVSNSDGWRDNSQASQGVARVGVTHYLGQSDKIFFDGSFSSQSYGTPGGVLGQVGQGNQKAAKFNNVGDKNIVNGTSATLGLSKAISPNDQFEIDFSYKDSGATQYTPNLTDKTTIYDKWGFDLNPRIKRSWGGYGNSVLGFDYSESMGSFITNTGNVQRANVTNKSYYLTHQFPLSKSLDLLGGVRRQTQDAIAYDYKNSTGQSSAMKEQSANAADLALNYRYGVADLQKIYIRVNRSYRFANIDEYWAMNADWSARVFTGILKPQESKTLEVGGDWKASYGFKYGVSLFRMDTSNEIRYCQSAACDYGSNINSSDIRRVGLNLLGEFEPVQDLKLKPKFTYQQAKFSQGEFSGKEVALVPNLIGSISISYKKNNATYFSNLNYVGQQFYDGDETNSLKKIPSYTSMDVGFGYKYGNWDSSLRVKNLLNKHYSNYGGYGFVQTAPGSTGYSYYYYPADPRAIFLSTRYTFK